MRITAVTCHLCGAANPSGYRAGSALVRVETDAGLCGHGEALLGLFCAEAAAAIVRYYQPLLLGRDPSAIDALWQRMFDSSVWWGRAGAAVSVLGAIEVALWDLAGKRAGRPCYELLSDRPRGSIPVYASLGAAPETPEQAAALVGRLQVEGFRALKLGLQFDDPTVGMVSPRGAELLGRLDRTLSAIRQVAGEGFVIGVDGHMGGIPEPMAAAEALEVARLLERYGVAFFEEPLSYLDPNGYAWLRRHVAVPIAGGESLSLRRGFEQFTDLGALDLLQPDVNYVGGFQQAAAVVRLAEERGLRVMPHSWCAGPGFVANLHLALAFDAVERVEIGRELTDLQAATLVEPPVIRDGLLVAPAAPGLGIDFDPVLGERFPYTPDLDERASGMITL